MKEGRTIEHHTYIFAPRKRRTGTASFFHEFVNVTKMRAMYPIARTEADTHVALTSQSGLAKNSLLCSLLNSYVSGIRKRVSD